MVLSCCGSESTTTNQDINDHHNLSACSPALKADQSQPWLRLFKAGFASARAVEDLSNPLRLSGFGGLRAAPRAGLGHREVPSAFPS